MADSERPGRIRGEELDLDLLAGADLRPPEGPSLGARAAQLAVPETRRHPEVDEPRTRHRNLADISRGLEMILDYPGNLARRLALGTGDHERQVSGGVAVRRVSGRFDTERRGRPRRIRGFEQTLASGAVERVIQQ